MQQELASLLEGGIIRGEMQYERYRVNPASHFVAVLVTVKDQETKERIQ
jgi:hypothetical protein